jgi:hypothetical protein
MKRALPSVFLAISANVSLAGGIDFVQQVQPVLEGSCLRCHNAEKMKGGLRLDTVEGFKKGGKSGPTVNLQDLEKSEILRRIALPRGHDELMPEEGEPLSGPFKKWLTDWVKGGAPWPEGVVLRAHKKEIVGMGEHGLIPAQAPKSLAQAADWIGDVLLKEQATEKLPAASPRVDDLSFLRRASVDLIGRIPTVEEIAKFQALPESSRREQWIDQLLKDARFSERWTVFFADMLRIRSQADGGSQLLEYVHQSLQEGKPYDEMTRELIGTNGHPQQRPAAGFVLSDDVQPMALAGATAQVFLGLRLACAECHDHPFDDWKQTEFYELAAFFGQTKRMEVGKVRRIYSTETDTMAVQWPPETEKPPTRAAVTPKFPFEMVTYKETPHFIKRLEQSRQQPVKATPALATDKSLDALLDEPTTASSNSKDAAMARKEAKAALQKIDVSKDLYRASALREKLAGLVTDPRNPYFARAFVNRVWAELVGRGFVEPLDNFSAYNQLRYPQTLQFIAQEFIATGYDVRQLIKLIMLSAPYQRGHLAAGADSATVALAETSFRTTRPRRILGEALFDSVITAGHLTNFKWPQGANLREVSRQIRVPLVPTNPSDKSEPSDPPMMMTAKKPKPTANPYDVEKTLSRSPADVANNTTNELAAMKAEADAALEAEKMAKAMAMAAQANNNERYKLETITERIDDNPKFSSTLLMETPAPPSHFLRVFGQPARDGLGEFRDEAPSLRQELLMLNGKATHEAARVGPLEPIAKLMSEPAKAIEHAYLEILTRRPTADEQRDAQAVLSAATTPLEGMADLRWALFNCHEFRFLP